MLQEFGAVLARYLRRLIPDSFVFALLLTLIVGVLATLLADAQPKQVIDAWYKGFWILLEFGMQVVLLLTTGFAIALSPSVGRLIDRAALLARGPGSVYFIVGVVGGIFGLVSWGWAVLTAVLARELASRVKGVDYAYLTACAYGAGIVWVCGLSSSIPLVLNTEGNFLIETGVLAQTIPIEMTLGSTMNWLQMGTFFLTMPALFYFLRPRHENPATIEDLREADAVDMVSIEEEAIAMAVAYGETSSNLLQPFFLLAILPVMGVGVRIQARDVMGYLVIPFVWVTVYTAVIVTWAPL